jgi:vitamin K-dependent gamma-carboxylase
MFNRCADMKSGKRFFSLSEARRWAGRGFEPVDIAALVYFRIAFGALMLWEVSRYLIAHRLSSLLLQPEFHFKYFGFGWVEAPPGDGMQVLYAILLASAAGITLGLWYRLCAIVFAIGFTWLFLIDAAQYLNHFYLICLISSLSILLPANRRFAIDSLRKPSLRSDTAPAWTLWLLRTQLAIVYFYGGIAKLNSDWLRGEPVRTWLGWRAEDSPGLLPIEWTVGLICYGGLLFDLLVVPLLLWRKTRLFGFALAVGFHLTNSWLFRIGVFPWLGIALTAMFFPPDWPRRFVARLRALLPAEGKVAQAKPIEHQACGIRGRGWIGAFLSVYLIAQLLIPFRHFLYPGNVSWTEEGHRFSWHMKLRSKSGDTKFFLLDPATREVWSLDSRAYLTPRQQQKMNGHPDMILEFAQHIGGLMAKQGRTNVHIHVIARAELNGRPAALLIDPDVNLLAVRRTLPPASWILPLDNKRPSPAWYLELISAEIAINSGSSSRLRH